MQRIKRIWLAGLAAAVAVLAGALAVLSREKPQDTLLPLCPYAAEEITALSYAGNGVEADFVKGSDAVWRLGSDPALPLQQAMVESTVESYAVLNASRKLAGDELAELPARSAAPLMTFSLTAGDTELSYTVDSLNNVTDTYYVYDASGNVYVVAKNDLITLCKSPRKYYKAQTLTEYQTADIAKMQVNDLAFVQTDGNWTLEDDAAAALDQSAVNKMAATVLQAQTQWTITAPEKDSAYGLDAPDVRATLTFTDGSSLTVTFGDLCPETEGDNLCYMAADCTPTVVYEVSATYKQAFAVTKDSLLAAE